MFGDRDSGAYLLKFAWTEIVRHTLVKGTASPDDPALTGYWAERRRKNKPPLDRYTLRLLATQDGRCPLCGDLLLPPTSHPSPPQWERWWLQVTRKAIATQLSRPPRGTAAHRTVTKPASYTPPASASTTLANAGNQHFNPAPS